MAQYEGYTNYETWAVGLEIDNDRETSENWANIADEIWEESTESDGFTREETALNVFAGALRDDHFAEVGELCRGRNGVFHDLLSAALQEVNWSELARGYIDEAKEREAEIV